MRALASAAVLLPHWRTLVLAAAAIFCGCTSGPMHPAATEIRDASGFTISERVRVGSDVRTDFQRAVGLLEQQDYPAAVALLLEVTGAAPQLTAAHIDLGIAYGRMGDLEHAQASLEQAVELEPNHPVALNELGVVYRRTGRFAEARQCYEKALARHPDFRFARKNLAILCDLYLADSGCALENYELYAQADPADPNVATWIADLRQRAGR